MPFMEPGSAFAQARRHFHNELGSRPIQKYYADLELSARALVRGLADDPDCLQLEKSLEQCV